MSIQVEQVEKTFGSVRALGPVGFVIPQGTQLALLGESGSGKSTLLNLLGCTEIPTKGRVLLDGRDTATLSDSELSKLRLSTLGYVHQFFDLVSDLSALENVLLPQWLSGVRDHGGRAEQLLRELGLGTRLHQLAANLSGGEQQRVAIARALVLSPKLLLADEPSGSLDSQNGAQVVQLLRQSAEQLGATLVMATHSQAAASQFRYHLRLRDGRVEHAELPSSTSSEGAAQ